MRASFVDLRKRSREIINALRRKEEVTVLYRGKPTAVLKPLSDEHGAGTTSALDHEAFGIWADHAGLVDVSAHVRGLRKGRFSDL